MSRDNCFFGREWLSRTMRMISECRRQCPSNIPSTSCICIKTSRIYHHSSAPEHSATINCSCACLCFFCVLREHNFVTKNWTIWPEKSQSGWRTHRFRSTRHQSASPITKLASWTRTNTGSRLAPPDRQRQYHNEE